MLSLKAPVVWTALEIKASFLGTMRENVLCGYNMCKYMDICLHIHSLHPDFVLDACNIRNHNHKLSILA